MGLSRGQTTYAEFSYYDNPAISLEKMLHSVAERGEILVKIFGPSNIELSGLGVRTK